MLCDYHVHTHYSDDSEYLMEDVVKDGINRGLSEICFTDHVDYGIKYDWDDPRAFQKRYETLLANVNYPEYEKYIYILFVMLMFISPMLWTRRKNVHSG